MPTARTLLRPIAPIVLGASNAEVIERFEADHPDLTATLRSIANSLHSMGI